MALAPIIMIHGAFCGGWTFDTFRKPFEAAGRTVLAPDLPGHAPGELVAGQSMTDYAIAIAKLIAEQETPPVLIGHSMGGLVAQMAADRATVAGLVLMAPSSPWGVPGQSLEEGVSAVSLYSLGPYWLQAVAPDRAITAQCSHDRLPAATQTELFARMAPESGRALFEVLNWWLDPTMATSVKNVGGAPVLTLAGGRDVINPAPTVRKTAQRLGGDYQVFSEMSHWLPGEPGWDQVAQASFDWISALPSRPA
jgi:pimeloyl-ACP methyl ester carboxylesterase